MTKHTCGLYSDNLFDPLQRMLHIETSSKFCLTASDAFTTLFAQK